MRHRTAQIILWVGLYTLLALMPLVVALIDPPAEVRGFWVEFGVGLGFVALALLCLQFVLTARFRSIAPKFGLDTVLQFHREAGVVILAFVVAHVVVLVAADSKYLAFLDPRVDAARAVFLIIALGGLVLLVGLTVLRDRVGLNYEWWRATHGAIAVAVLVISVVHVLRVGHYVAAPWKQVLWVVLTGLAVTSLVWVRGVRPILMLRRPYHVVAVSRERGRAWTLTLEAVGHAGIHFHPGQFAWLTLGASPFSIDQHPFSLVSSAEQPERPAFTIKSLGDFTSGIKDVKPGTVAYLDGPYGAFTIDFIEAPAVAFIAGGIGIVPIMSMLRTLADRGYRRRLILIYGNRTWEDVAFREELDALTGRLALEVVHVLERPHDGWQGPSGLISAALLAERLPLESDPQMHYFVCGPVGMMDVVERTLLSRGIPRARIHSERFHIA
jgi:predicted ferric reductase